MNRTYLDTSLLLRAILDKSELKALAGHTLERMRSSGYEVIIPHIVIGESFSQIIIKSQPSDIQRHIKELLEWIQKLIPTSHTCMPPVSKEVCTLALELLSEETWIDPCDIIIISHALLDPNSRYLLTTDENIHRSLVILNKMNELKSSGRRTYDLEITDSI